MIDQLDADGDAPDRARPPPARSRRRDRAPTIAGRQRRRGVDDPHRHADTATDCRFNTQSNAAISVCPTLAV